MLAETGDLLGSLSDAWTFAGQGPSWRSPGQGGCRAQGGAPLNRAAAAEVKAALPGVGRRQGRSRRSTGHGGGRSQGGAPRRREAAGAKAADFPIYNIVHSYTTFYRTTALVGLMFGRGWGGW